MHATTGRCLRIGRGCRVRQWGRTLRTAGAIVAALLASAAISDTSALARSLRSGEYIKQSELALDSAQSSHTVALSAKGNIALVGDELVVDSRVGVCR